MYQSVQMQLSFPPRFPELDERGTDPENSSNEMGDTLLLSSVLIVQ